MKGQSSLEFLSMVSLTMLILAALTGLMTAKQQDTINYQAERNADFIASKTSFQIEMALVQGEGYSRTFSLPGGIKGSNYTVEVGGGGVDVEWQDSSIYEISRFQGEEIEINVDRESNIFRVENNRSGVFLVES